MPASPFPDQIVSNPFEFHVVRPEHYELLHQWLNAPHISEYWDGAVSMNEVVGKYDQKFHSSIERAYIVKSGDQQIGYISAYLASKVGGGWWPEEEEDTVGVDLFVGEEKLLGQGLGSAFLLSFSDWLLEQDGINKIILDPDPENLVAINSYQKAGFVKVGIITTPDGESLLMEKMKSGKS